LLVAVLPVKQLVVGEVEVVVLVDIEQVLLHFLDHLVLL
jgi:hypothetical protein